MHEKAGLCPVFLRLKFGTLKFFTSGTIHPEFLFFPRYAALTVKLTVWLGQNHVSD